MATARSRRPTSADPELDGDARALHAAVGELVRVYQFRDRERICMHDVSVTQCYALAALVEQGPIGLSRLAAALYLDKSTASRVVDSLEAKGYVRRDPDPADGRALLLAPTRKGRGLHARIERELVERTRELAADFDPPVRRALVELIGRLARAAAERSGRGSCAGDAGPGAKQL